MITHTPNPSTVDIEIGEFFGLTALLACSWSMTDIIISVIITKVDDP